MRPFPNGRMVFLLAFGSAALIAQAIQTAEMTGEVRDNKGAGLEGVRVILSSPALQGVRTYLTDERGHFSARLLPPGDYSVQLIKAGFQTVKAPQRLSLGQSYSPRFTLQPEGNVVVEVVATLSQLDATSVSTTSNFEMAEMEVLPLQRTPEQMLILTPGVVDSANGTLAAATPTGYEAIRGSMTSNNLFLIDGQNVNDPVYGNRGVSTIDDAIQEVQIITGAIPAEYGDVDGGVINTITKGGGNEFTGAFRLEGSDGSWNAVQPLQDRTAIPHKFNYDERVTVGGYILKDKLWFFASGYQLNQSTAGAIQSGVYAGTPYTAGTLDKRMQLKLTYLVNTENTLTFSYLTHNGQLTNNNFISGDLQSLEPQLQQDGVWSLNWLANLQADFSMELRLGEKRQGLTGGGTIPGVIPVIDIAYSPNATYYNGIFNDNDGGDHRDNKNADLKLTYVFQGAGSHEMSFGVNYMDGVHRAQNQQSPTNSYFIADNFNPAPGAEEPASSALEFSQYYSSSAKAYDTSIGFYVNDKWAVDKNLNFNLGIRVDRYHAYSTDTSSSAGASGWSPRLGVKYDLFGDAKWQFAASFCRYNASPLANIVNAVSNSGNPTEVDYAYGGPLLPDGNIAQSAFLNPANWNQQLDYISPLTTLLSNNLRTPHTDEWQVSAAHSFRFNDREGFVKLTLVNKSYKDLFDFEYGDSGTVLPPAPFAGVGPQYYKEWINSDLARRLYKDAELEAGWQGDRLHLQGNITWSVLEGNYQGEYNGYGPEGEGLQTFTVINGQQIYDSAPYHPYGKLIGDVPLRLRGAADYHWDWTWGRTTLGALYRFDSGQHVSEDRLISPNQIDPVNLAFPQVLGITVPPWLQYYDNQRGGVVFPSQAYTDVTVTQDFKVVPVAGKAVKAFLKLDITNVFNHQQQISWQNIWQSPNLLTDPWVPVPAPLGPSNYGTARQYRLEAGFKF